MEKLIKKKPLYNVSEISVSYVPKYKVSERPLIFCSKASYELCVQLWDRGFLEFVEQFRVILLNRANRVLGIYLVSTGGISGTIVDPKIIFGVALKACASSIIMVHNHPSGNLRPSEADMKLTKKIADGGQLLDISVLDHIIISANGYYSFADEGLM